MKVLKVVHKDMFVLLFGLCSILLLCQKGNSQNISKIEKGKMAEKAVMDNVAVENWSQISQVVHISNNGEYISYNIINTPLNKSTLIVQSILGNWKMEIVNGVPIMFSKNNRYFIFRKNDTASIVELGVSNRRGFSQVASWKQPDIKGEWVAFHLHTNELILYNVEENDEVRFENVSDYYFDEAGNSLLLQIQNKSDSLQLLQLFNISTRRLTQLYSSKISGNKATISGCVLDKKGEQVVFIEQTTNTADLMGEYVSHDVVNRMWYYNTGMEKPRVVLDDRRGFSNQNLSLGSSMWFSKDGGYIFTYLQKKVNGSDKKDNVRLNVWNYKDTILQCSQIENNDNLLEKKSYLSVYSIATQKLVFLEKNMGDYVIKEPSSTGNYVILNNNTNGDRYWVKNADSNWLVSLQDGSRVYLNIHGNPEFYFSPNGKYLVYFDSYSKKYFSYNISTRHTFDISKNISFGKFAWLSEFSYVPGRPKDKSYRSGSVGVAGWLDNDSSLLVYDNYDIWRLDLEARISPSNISKGFGSSQNIKFRLLSNKQEGEEVLSSKISLILTAFNTKNKHNGFYKVDPMHERYPEILTMGPYTYFHSGLKVLPTSANEFNSGIIPLKAKNIDLWVVQRQSATDAPNLFVTNDFKKFNQITFRSPQEKYNWIKTELVSWDQGDGIRSQGILYKPENFDSTKRYPLIIHYYEQFSHRLFEFPTPSFTKDAYINIPWFVSRDYLVFTPDIYYIKDRVGFSAKRTVESAAIHLSHLPYVDPKRIGIAGHSFAGRETNYIVANTKIFAAAFEGAGVSDVISSSLQLSGGNSKNGSRLASYDLSMGSLWEHLNLYIKESAVFNAHKVVTPLLMFHCVPDGAVPWEQAIEFYIALRRLGKRVWLLEYDNGSHAVSGQDARDLTIRVTQFFDYYLKGALPPKWMTSGIRASMKGEYNGLELDNSGVIP